MRKLKNEAKKHDYWHIECWSGRLLCMMGIYGLLSFQEHYLSPSFIYGFLRALPENLWQVLFICCGFLQIFFLRNDDYIGRFFCSTLAFILYGWGAANIFFYGHSLHFSFFPCAAFSLINLCALPKLLQGMGRESI